jgi:undecaprenyl phosphate-alpha-L-ara4N flippase subunit ArnE
VLQVIGALFTVACLSAGQLLFKQASADVQFSLSGLLHPKLLVAIVIYGIATLAWVFTLRNVNLTVAYPLTALAFITVPIAAHYVLGEPLRANLLIGAGLIIAGVYISSFS